MSKTFQRVFDGLGEQKLGHCRATRYLMIENIIKFQLELAVININEALGIKQKTIKGRI